jgi:aspartyl-tRNA(Asn)/glutamyl-tRNA(Gln) amidotransferase subunit B
MEEGNFRCDANISIRPQGSQELGTRTEIKNLNSFKFVEKALSYEAKRQIALVSNGEVVVQATLLFDSDKAITKVMRSKEEAADYRYFPDPDLPPLHLSSEFIDSIKAVMPELPIAKKKRFMEDLALSAYDATVLTANKEIADFFEECLKHYSQPKLVCNWITSELFGILKFKNLTLAQSNITPDKLGILLKLLNDDVINANSAKLVLTKLIENGGDPRAIIQQKGLAQTSSKTELLAIVQKIFADNPQQLQEYQAGKENLLGFFVGQVMKATQGKANPKLLNELIRDEAKKN